MNEERLRDLYARGIAARDTGRGSAGVAREVTPEELQALVRCELPEEQRLELLDRVMSSERLRAEFELLRSVEIAGRGAGRASGTGTGSTGSTGSPSVDAIAATATAPDSSGQGSGPLRPTLIRGGAPRVVSAEPRRARRSTWTTVGAPLGLAATLLLAVGLQLRNTDLPGEVLRGDGASLGLVSPGAEPVAADSIRFTWRSIAGASRYRFELLDTDGLAVTETITTDTTIVVAAGDRLRPGAEYRWLVRSTDPAGAQRTSEVRRLRLRAQ